MQWGPTQAPQYRHACWHAPFAPGARRQAASIIESHNQPCLRAAEE